MGDRVNTYAKKLASNDIKIRKKGIKLIRNWLRNQSVAGKVLDDGECLRLWKGIFYSFWMSDKALYQEELADMISNFILLLEGLDSALIFLDSFFKTMSREWFSIDKFRIEKFMMLVRLMLRKAFKRILSLKPKERMIGIRALNKTLMGTVLSADYLSKCPVSLKIHVADIYLDEIGVATNGKLKEKFLRKLIRPYCVILGKSQCKTLIAAVKKSIFNYIMDSTLFRDMENTEKANVSDEEEMSYIEIYTRGFGRNELRNMSRLQFDCDAVAVMLKNLTKKSLAKNRKSCYNLVKKLQKVGAGQGLLFSKVSLLQNTGEYQVLFNNSVNELLEETAGRKPKRKSSWDESSSIKKRKKLLESDDSKNLSNISSGRDSVAPKASDCDIDTMPESVKPPATKKKKTVAAKKDPLAVMPKGKSKNIVTNIVKSGTSEVSSPTEELLVYENSPKHAERGILDPIDNSKVNVETPIHSKKPNASLHPPESDTSVLKHSKSSPKTSKKRISLNKIKIIADSSTENVENVTCANVAKAKLLSSELDGNVIGCFTDGSVPTAPSINKSFERKASPQKSGKKSAKKIKKNNVSAVTIDIKDNLVFNSENLSDNQSARKTRKATEKQEHIDSLLKSESIHNDIDDLQEIEIVIPNKKYKGNQKIKPAISSPNESIQKILRTPPAFVRKSVKKFISISTIKQKKGKARRMSEAPDPNRRVNFALARNELHEHCDYEKDIKSSPLLPFNARKQPDQGVLKSTPEIQRKQLKVADFSGHNDFGEGV